MVVVDLLVSFAGTFLALLAGYWIWHKQKQSEPRYENIQFLNSKKMDALMKVWSLLAYITDTENPLSVIVWEQEGKNKAYYIRLANGAEYIDKLAEIFYGGGYGLLLSEEIKKLLYEYRSILYGLLLKEKGGGENVRLTNEEMVKRMRAIYKKLNEKLREEVEQMKE